mgnify:FL=1
MATTREELIARFAVVYEQQGNAARIIQQNDTITRQQGALGRAHLQLVPQTTAATRGVTAFAGAATSLVPQLAAAASAAALFGAAAKGAADVIREGRMMENTTEQLTAFMGSAEAATARVRELEQLSLMSDVSLRGLEAANEQLEMFDLNAQKLLPDIARAADLMGRDITEVVNALSLASLGQTRGLRRFAIDVKAIQRELGITLEEGAQLTKAQQTAMIEFIVYKWKTGLTEAVDTTDDKLTQIANRFAVLRRRIFEGGLGDVIHTTLEFTIKVLDVSGGLFAKAWALAQGLRTAALAGAGAGLQVGKAALTLAGVDATRRPGQRATGQYETAIGPPEGPPARPPQSAEQRAAEAEKAMKAAADFRKRLAASIEGSARDPLWIAYLQRQYEALVTQGPAWMEKSAAFLAESQARILTEETREGTRRVPLPDVTAVTEQLDTYGQALTAQFAVWGDTAQAQRALDVSSEAAALDAKTALQEAYYANLRTLHAGTYAVLEGGLRGYTDAVARNVERQLTLHKTEQNVLVAIAKATLREMLAGFLDYMSKKAQARAAEELAEAAAALAKLVGFAFGPAGAAASLGKHLLAAAQFGALAGVAAGSASAVRSGGGADQARGGEIVERGGGATARDRAFLTGAAAGPTHLTINATYIQQGGVQVFGQNGIEQFYRERLRPLIQQDLTDLRALRTAA